MVPEFSVIVPTRGDSPHLRAALASALESRESLEVLIAHDRRDAEPELPSELSSDRRVRTVRSPGPGPAAARNAALDQASGRLLAFLDDDDVWLPHHLSRARASLAERPRAVLYCCDAYLLQDDTADGSARVARPIDALPRFAPGFAGPTVSWRELLLANPVLTPTVVLVGELVDPTMRFRDDLPVMEDYELWLRLARRHELVFDPEPGVVVRRRGGSASADGRRIAEGGLRIFDELQSAGLTGDLLPRELRRRVGELWHDLAYFCLLENDLPGFRRALRESRVRLPLKLKNYIYLLLGAVPIALRRRWLMRRRRARSGDPGPGVASER